MRTSFCFNFISFIHVIHINLEHNTTQLLMSSLLSKYLRKLHCKSEMSLTLSGNMYKAQIEFQMVTFHNLILAWPVTARIFYKGWYFLSFGS